MKKNIHPIMKIYVKLAVALRCKVSCRCNAAMCRLNLTKKFRLGLDSDWMSHQLMCAYVESCLDCC